MERKDKTEFFLTKADVNRAIKDYIEEAYGEFLATADVTYFHEIGAVEPPVGVSDLGSPIYEFHGSKVSVS